MALIVVVNFFAGTASQKLVPGVDEVIPFFGWSLFSKVPNQDSRYTIVIHAHGGHGIEPPVAFLRAPDTIVKGNRYIGRKLIERLGRAKDRGDGSQVESLRDLLEQHYLRGTVRYELVFESYQPLDYWLTGERTERRSLAHFESGGGR